ncbi:MAG: DUF1275 family protein [Armatimonadota bacterium]|nr:DUF1275 family protein [Armatimonadota bacterium]
MTRKPGWRSSRPKSSAWRRVVQEKARLGLLLAWVAGGVDATGFLTLAHLFTAHMSGNSVALAVSAAQGHWMEAARRAFPIPLFVVGALWEWH